MTARKASERRQATATVTVDGASATPFDEAASPTLVELQLLETFRGDLVNRSEFTPAAREPDPTLLLRGYERAALTLNFVRALCDGGFRSSRSPTLSRHPSAR